MKLIAKKSNLKGTVTIPGSKSHTIRAVAIAALADGESTIRNPLTSNDTLSAVSCYQALGAKINTKNFLNNLYSLISGDLYERKTNSY